MGQPLQIVRRGASDVNVGANSDTWIAPGHSILSVNTSPSPGLPRGWGPRDHCHWWSWWPCLGPALAPPPRWPRCPGWSRSTAPSPPRPPPACWRWWARWPSSRWWWPRRPCGWPAAGVCCCPLAPAPPSWSQATWEVMCCSWGLGRKVIGTFCLQYFTIAALGTLPECCMGGWPDTPVWLRPPTSPPPGAAPGSWPPDPQGRGVAPGPAQTRLLTQACHQPPSIIFCRSHLLLLNLFINAFHNSPREG